MASAPNVVETGEEEFVTQPLLIVDGDSFAHRSYHAVPKTIRRAGGRGGNAIVGFANFLIRLYQEVAPRAVMVGWDTLEVATYRHEAFAPYQSGRDIEENLIEQLNVLPSFVEACGFTAGKGPGYEADDFWPPRSHRRRRMEARPWWRAATGTPFNSSRSTPECCSR